MEPFKERAMSAFLPSGFPRPGVRFVPTEEELVCYYLHSKINGESCGDLIQDMDLYSREPWFLPHKTHPLFEEHEWFYFVKLVQLSSKADGNRPKRTVGGDHSSSYWRTTVGDKPVLSATGQVVGLKKCLTFYTDKNESNKAGVASDWTMIEYRLNSQSFQDQVICRIRHNIKRTHSGADSSLTQEEQLSPTDSLAASSSTQKDQSSPAESDINVFSPQLSSCVDASVDLDISGLGYGSAPIELEQSVATREENWHQGYIPMLTTEGSVPFEFVDDETFMIGACPIAFPNTSEYVGYAPTISRVPSQSSFAHGVEIADMDTDGFDDAKSVQNDTYMEEALMAEDENRLQVLYSTLIAEGSDLLEFADDEICMIEAPDVPWMEDQRSLGVCAMDVTSQNSITCNPDTVESANKNGNIQEKSVPEWLENFAEMMRAEDNMALNVSFVADPSLDALWC